MNAAHARIVQAGGFSTTGRNTDPIKQIAAEIVRGHEGEAFLKAVRRGRPTSQQNIRYQLLRAVEDEIGAGVPRRRSDRNTPEAVHPKFEFFTATPEMHEMIHRMVLKNKNAGRRHALPA